MRDIIMRGFLTWVVNTPMISNFLITFFSIYAVILILYSMMYIVYDRGRRTMTSPFVVITYGLMGGIPGLIFILYFVYLYTEILHMPLLL